MPTTIATNTRSCWWIFDPFQPRRGLAQFFLQYSKRFVMDENKQHPPTKGNEKARQPDPETLGTTDPQEHMKGPLSSLMQKTKDKAEKNDDQEQDKHDHKKNSTGGDFISK